MEIAGIELTGFDVVVLAILALSALLSFARGFSREIISILALVIALVGALFIFGRYQIAILDFIKPAWLANAFLLGGVFVLLYMIVTFVMRGWAKSLQGKSPGFLDRILGLGFGALRGLILSSLFVIVASSLAKDGEPAGWMRHSLSYPSLRKTADMLENLPFAKAKKIADDIKDQGENSELLPDLKETPETSEN